MLEYQKGYTPNWSEEAFVIKNVIMLLLILTVQKLMELFTEKLQTANQKEFRFEKLIKRKGDKLHLKWKG